MVLSDQKGRVYKNRVKNDKIFLKYPLFYLASKFQIYFEFTSSDLCRLKGGN